MHNELLHIGPITIYGYGLMMAVGIVAAFLVAMKRAKKYGTDEDTVFYLGIWAGIGGLVGAKVMYWIVELPTYLANPKLFLNVADGFVVYGGIVLGIFTGWLYTRRKHLNFFKMFDLVMPSIALAQAFGRIGCFLAGCCYGKETASACHIVFKNSQFAPNNVKLIPTQLMSSALNFLHFGVLLGFARKKRYDGQVGSLYLILYSIGRFAMEYFRGDPRGSVWLFSTSQFIAIFTLIAGVVLYRMCTVRGAIAEADAEYEAEKAAAETKDTDAADKTADEAEAEPADKTAASEETSEEADHTEESAEKPEA